ncbi:hypothetical protein CERSUDRAFT_103640 [Gelatoporia subvermispora B]|uniref:DNA-directed RNA polymerase III subunit RPC9 n=1 Tax=Ceriporiopsis subvermispora (strain B) TaxID=914234 RepID=M2QRC9_CERS8|nr:hypothetical protein CERSUDRAFT_103640 [Gelatoporia subvermispora B]
MEVVNQRAALLSNYEVLTLLRELESDHLARTKTALRLKKEEEQSGTKVHAPQEDVCENLRTIEVEAIQYLSADYQPTASQSEAGIAQLTKSLSAFDLTKSEKLQIVNLAPTEPVELYVIVEELEDRLGDHMDSMLSLVKASLSEPAAPTVNGAPDDAGAGNARLQYPSGNAQVVYEEETTWQDYQVNEEVFDDTGEGAGIEGDLDMDDDGE